MRREVGDDDVGGLYAVVVVIVDMIMIIKNGKVHPKQQMLVT